MSLCHKHIRTNICLGILLLVTAHTFGQLNLVPSKNNCLETRYTLSRQGKVEQLFEKKYNDQGLLVKETNTFSTTATGNYKEEFVYEYDPQGNNTRVIFSHNNVVKKITQKNYSLTGKLTQEATSGGAISNPLKKTLFSESGAEQIFFDKDGVTETLREKTNLDKNGQVITKEIVNAEGKLAFSDKYTYASPGKVSRWVHFDAAANIVTVTSYEYDPAWNVTKETSMRNDVLYAETLNTYNTNGNLEKKTRFNGKNQIDYYFTYEYNAKGLLTRENYFYNNELLSMRTFDYDANGNKLKEVYANSGGKTAIVKEWEYLCN